jgi:hypothetical protein
MSQLIDSGVLQSNQLSRQKRPQRRNLTGTVTRDLVNKKGSVLFQVPLGSWCTRIFRVELFNDGNIFTHASLYEETHSQHRRKY